MDNISVCEGSMPNEPPISQEGAEQDWAKWNMPIASSLRKIKIPSINKVLGHNRELNQLMLFLVFVAHNNHFA